MATTTHTSPPPQPTKPHTLSTLLTTLLPSTHLTHQPPPHPSHPHLTPLISSLSLHPTLEATLHLLNADLPSAHFLVRHMSGPPAVEGMLLHSILHRCEADYRNARAWMRDVEDACEGWVPKRKGEIRLREGVWRGCGCGCVGLGLGLEGGLVEWVYEGGGGDPERLIGDVEGFRRGKLKCSGGGDMKGGGEEEEKKIERRVRRELERVMEWCRRKFGEGEWLDASEAWVRPGEEVRSIGNDMVSGEKGWRQF